MKAGFAIEPMSEGDLGEVLRIENDSFSHPFSENLFRQELKSASANPYVVRDQDEIVGYIDYWVAAGEAHITTLAVRCDRRRQKIGADLIRFMLDDLKKRSIPFVYLDVRPSNEAALALYRGFGFQRIGIREKYYPDNDEDALVMALDLLVD